MMFFEAPKITSTAKPHWDGLNNRQFLLQHCNCCSSWIYYPRNHCTECNSSDLEWKIFDIRATLYSFSTDKNIHGLKTDKIPVLVDIGEGLRLCSYVLNNSIDRLRIGMKLKPVYQNIAQNQHGLFFEYEEEQTAINI